MNDAIVAPMCYQCVTNVLPMCYQCVTNVLSYGVCRVGVVRIGEAALFVSARVVWVGVVSRVGSWNMRGDGGELGACLVTVGKEHRRWRARQEAGVPGA